MKKLSQTIALIAVTTLFATAFTTNHFAQQDSSVATAPSDSNIARIVIIGKRMSTQEKIDYDAQVNKASRNVD